MGLWNKYIGGLERWLMNRKETRKVESFNVYNRRRKNIDIIKKLCTACDNNKMWYKNGKWKCTKCGAKIDT